MGHALHIYCRCVLNHLRKNCPPPPLDNIFLPHSQACLPLAAHSVSCLTWGSGSSNCAIRNASLSSSVSSGSLRSMVLRVQ